MYKRAVKLNLGEKRVEETIAPNSKQINTSSSDEIDTSDDLIVVSPNAPNLHQHNQSQFFVDEDDQGRRRDRDHRDHRRQRDNDRERGEPQDERRAGEMRADEVIRQAEASKARMFDVTGWCNNDKSGFSQEVLHAALVDEKYSIVGAHLDRTTKLRIENGEYVDFAKLLPKDRVALAEEDCLEMRVNKEGRTFWTALSDREKSPISSYFKWEIAFRIFMNIYVNKYPNKAVELTQYHHIIHSASQTFTWENVYAYDKDFRIHLGEYPNRSWAVILQLAWSHRLKDKVNTNGKFQTGMGEGSGRNKNKKDPCWKFNRGKCTYSLSCRFDHRCALCSKFGHGSHICRRANRNTNNSNGNNIERETGERSVDYRRDDKRGVKK